MDVVVSEEALSLLVQYWKSVLTANRQINLVSRSCDFASGLLLHLADSLSGLMFPFPEERLKVLDFGSGAGLPGLPLKIARPAWDIFLAEGTVKKAEFLRRVSAELGLSGVTVHPYNIGPKARSGADGLGNFGLVTVRAVSSLAYIGDRVSPLIAEGGFLLAYKGPNFREEADKCEPALVKGGLFPVAIKKFVLPGTERFRALLLYRKKT
ncbi:MAG: class I SAM-dependent methyltransferase [Deltaproteobacteria bacterium]|nr:class I SAM-dependent methyltransferase [Deltaproteobacteria bacterium]